MATFSNEAIAQPPAMFRPRNAHNKGGRYGRPDCLCLLRLPLDINLSIVVGTVT